MILVFEYDPHRLEIFKEWQNNNLAVEIKKEERKLKVEEEISESGLWSLGLECR